MREELALSVTVDGQAHKIQINTRKFAPNFKPLREATKW